MVSDQKPLPALPVLEKESIKATVSDLREDADLWFRIQVLLYDLDHISQDRRSETRISSTIHALYISEPYFSEAESHRIRTALFNDCRKMTDNDETASIGDVKSANIKQQKVNTPRQITVEEAMYSRLANLLDKRKASSDARP